MVLAALCGGLYPSVCRVVLPPKLFAETKSGAMLRDAAAEDMRCVGGHYGGGGHCTG